MEYNKCISLWSHNMHRKIYIFKSSPLLFMGITGVKVVLGIVIAAIVVAIASYGIYTALGQIDLQTLPPGIAESLKLLPLAIIVTIMGAVAIGLLTNTKP